MRGISEICLCRSFERSGCIYLVDRLGFERGKVDRGFCEVWGSVGAGDRVDFALEFWVVEGEADVVTLEGCGDDRVVRGAGVEGCLFDALNIAPVLICVCTT
jgi:hypothetical protein